MDVDATTVPLEALDTLWDYDDPAGSEERFLVLAGRARSSAAARSSRRR